MSKLRAWGVDKLIAAQILRRLKIEAKPELIEEIGVELAEHRADIERWVASRVQSRVIELLEEHSMQDFGRMEEDWANGFRAAEEVVARKSLDELLNQPSGDARTKGQILRSKVRAARRESAIIEKRS